MLDILQKIEQKLKTCYPVDSRSAKVVNEVKDMITEYMESRPPVMAPMITIGGIQPTQEPIKIPRPRNKKGTQ